MKGDYAESVEAYARCSEVMGFPENAVFIRDSFEGGWQAFLKMMTEPSDKRPITFSHYIVAVFFATLGNSDGAFAELDNSFAKRESHLVMVKVDPRFEKLHDDPRFHGLLKRIGFPE